MPTIELTAKVSIALDDPSIASLEEQIHRQLRKVAQQMLVTACQRVEQQALVGKRKTVSRQRLEEGHLLSLFGWVRLWRCRVKEADGHSRCPLDEPLGLEARQHASPRHGESPMETSPGPPG